MDVCPHPIKAGTVYTTVLSHQLHLLLLLITTNLMLLLITDK